MTRHLVTTDTEQATCRHCRGLVLAGWVDGLAVRVDPRPLDPPGELTALLAGLATYALRPSGLVHRDADRIADKTPPGLVLAAHRCDRRVPAPPKTRPPKLPPEPCPY